MTTTILPTIEELATWTAQQVFDHVAAHLLRQGHSSEFDGYPLYRHENGDMCAIGCLMPANVYDKSLEWRRFSSILGQPEPGPLRLWAFAVRPHSEWLVHLQVMHDTQLARHWREELTQLAKMYALSEAILDSSAEEQ